MLTASDIVYGWSPDRDDDVEVNVSQDICFPLITHPPMAPSSDRRAQRNRNRDPSWIPRPRNAFIIFRCEYSREHAQSAQGSQNDPDSDTSVKTLSKRAAEAWKQLSASERERYKILADREREEHARLYPNYRFRPMKRLVSGTRKSSCERSQSPKGGFVEGRPVPAAYSPSVLSTAPKKPRLNPSVDPTELSTSIPQLTAAPFVEPLSGLDQTHEDLERAQALEAYVIGLYNHDLFSPFSFPEYY